MAEDNYAVQNMVIVMDIILHVLTVIGILKVLMSLYICK